MITVLSAPTNLGLRPPVPGTWKAPEALRAAGLRQRLGGIDGGSVLPGRYVDDDAVRPAAILRNEGAIVDHARRLAARLRHLLDEGAAPLVLGGDCSLLVGAGLGCRDDDEELEEVTATIARTIRASEAVELGMREAGEDLLHAVGTSGCWLQIDVDVLDPAWMPAVDSPDDGGLEPDQLVELLRTLAPAAVGAAVTVFDPDLDPDGRYAALLVDVVAAGLSDLGARHRRG